MSATRIKQIKPRPAPSRRWVFILFLSLPCRDPIVDPLLQQIERQRTVVEHGAMNPSNVKTSAQFLRCFRAKLFDFQLRPCQSSSNSACSLFEASLADNTLATTAYAEETESVVCGTSDHKPSGMRALAGKPILRPAVGSHTKSLLPCWCSSQRYRGRVQGLSLQRAAACV
jgi:hypothetical protein